MGINRIIRKRNSGVDLSPSEIDLLDKIAYEFPDCLAYESEQRSSGVNFLFFEQGFNKLSIRQIALKLVDNSHKNYNKIVCAEGRDYSPRLKGYCGMFVPRAKIKYKDLEADTEENDTMRKKIQVICDWAKRN